MHRLHRTVSHPDASARSVVKDLRSRLAVWFSPYVDPQRDGIDKGVNGCGEVGSVDAAGVTAFADDHTESTDWDLWLEKKRA